MFMMTLAGLVLLAAALAVASPPCPKGHGFWDMSGQKCTQCTVCAHNEVVLLPCQPYKDTMCGPISALNINWPWQRPSGGHSSRATTTTSTFAPSTRYFFTKKMRPLARKVTMTKTTPTMTSSSTSTTPIPEVTTETATTETEVVKEVEQVTTSPMLSSSTEASSFSWTESSSEATTKVSAQPFLATETSVEWDWQALALAVTIATFVVLLVVFAVYAAVHARRATARRRRLQKDLDAARLSLFPVSRSEDAELQTFSASSSPKGLYNSNQCLYLEKLLEQKQCRRANIYVETGRQATPAPARRSSRWKEKELPAEKTP
ncbi:uncharacterized protein LOC132205127 [Neocloeon triangulifer]|uniref:uncharacterized protein LOC132205127 n=1 Tax=Neocloeon triangulifer TaxID=2078957 RepID=UPI00286F2181|nr:uncharacterized protein LOC132205127 [Neocloeon triangulifer]